MNIAIRENRVAMFSLSTNNGVILFLLKTDQLTAIPFLLTKEERCFVSRQKIYGRA